MADQKKQDSHMSPDDQSASQGRGAAQSGSPGPTPGSAEGDLRDQGGNRQSS